MMKVLMKKSPIAAALLGKGKGKPGAAKDAKALDSSPTAGQSHQ
jgi:hypothetical protein